LQQETLLVNKETHMVRLEDLQAAKAELSKQFLVPTVSQPLLFRLGAAVRPTPSQNVVGVGIGEKFVKGRPVGEQVVKFFVRAKFSENQILPGSDQLPASIHGIPTDVEEVGLIYAFGAPPLQTLMPPPVHVFWTPPLDPRVRMRPVRPGCSIGFASDRFKMAGTFGALVKDEQRTYILSNNHVLADSGNLPEGTPIYSPGTLDGGDPQQDQIAQLRRFAPFDPNAPNTADAALAEVTDTSLVSNDILQIGPPTGTTRAQFLTVVHKFGRTTEYTRGVIASIDTDIKVAYDTGDVIFGSQIIIVGLDASPFSEAGDSGSLILEKTSNKAIGLLFAGSTSHTVANHIDDVLGKLNVGLAL
jgi:Peptidase family S64